MTTATRTRSTTAPASPEAEQVVLGTVIHVANTHDDVARHLTVDDFHVPNHQTIYEAAFRLYRDGKPCGEAAVASLMRREGTLDRIGNTAYLSTLLDNSQPSSIDYYADVVREAAVKRRVIDVHTRGMQQAHSPLSANDLLTNTQAELDALVAGQVRDHNKGQDLLDIVTAQLFDWEHGTDGPHTPTYITALDARLGGGLYPSTLTLIAARTSVGKTCLALNIATNIAVRAEGEKLPVHYINLEMSNKGLARRVLADLAKVQYGHIINGSADDGTGLTPDDHDKIAGQLPVLADAPFRIVDCASLTPSELRAMVKAYRREMGGKLGLVVVDHVGLMTPDTGVSNNRNIDQGTISRALKTLSKAEEIPVLALVQINRSGNSIGELATPPHLHHLKDSGSLEEDADNVIVMFRPEVADKDTERVGEADLIMRKARDTERDEVALVSFQGHYQRVRDMAEG